MANLVRITGNVIFGPTLKEGISAKTGNAYSMQLVNVLVAKRDVVELTLPKDLSRIGGEVVREGSSIDWLVSVDVFAGRLQWSVEGLFPSAQPAAAAAWESFDLPAEASA